MTTPLNAVVQSVASAPGTGAIALGSAVSGFQTFAAAGAVNGGSYSYRIDDGGNFELGVGVYTAGANPSLSRTLVYSSTGALLPASAASVVSCVALAADLVMPPIPQGVPPGVVAYFALNSAPTGWFAADGSAVSRTTYANLFAAIGTTWGAGDGSTTFNIPDLRGYFLRPMDNGRGIDPGRGFGSGQGSQNLSHVHSPAGGSYFIANAGGSPANIASGPYLTVNTMAASGGNESRPINIAILVCIKY